MPVLIMVDRKTKIRMTEVLPRKGTGEYAIERGFRMLDAMGYEELILKSDQEPSIMALKRELKERIKGTVKMEESPVGEHQSNGMVENGVQRIQGQFRVRRHALEARYKERIGGNHNC